MGLTMGHTLASNRPCMQCQSRVAKISQTRDPRFNSSSAQARRVKRLIGTRVPLS